MSLISYELEEYLDATDDLFVARAQSDWRWEEELLDLLDELWWSLSSFDIRVLDRMRFDP